MKICYFGSYQSERKFPRNQVIINALKSSGHQIIEQHSQKSVWIRWIIFLSRWQKVLKSNLIFVGVPGHFDVFPAKILSLIFKKPLIFDVFISLYDQIVIDKKIHQPKSIKANIYYLIDKFSCELADSVIVDTQEHKKHFVSFFNLPETKIHVIPVGTNESLFKPLNVKKHKKWTAYFHGNYLPLQGVPVIVEAANLLRKHPIQFILRGNGHDYNLVSKLIKKHNLKNVILQPSVSYSKLPEHMAKANLFLAGPFGHSAKARLVIPNKVYEAIAMKIPVIAADTKAVRELLSENSATLVAPNNPKALAQAILSVYNNENLAISKSITAYSKFISVASGQQIAKKLEKIINLVNSQFNDFKNN